MVRSGSSTQWWDRYPTAVRLVLYSIDVQLVTAVIMGVTVVQSVVIPQLLPHAACKARLNPDRCSDCVGETTPWRVDNQNRSWVPDHCCTTSYRMDEGLRQKRTGSFSFAQHSQKFKLHSCTLQPTDNLLTRRKKEMKKANDNEN